MRAVTIDHAGGPEVLRLDDVPAPVPAAGEVLVKVAAAGVNRADLLQRAGHYPPPDGAPAWPGLEVSGTVVGLGPGVTQWSIGDRVCALISGGGYAELVAVPSGLLLAVPHGLDLIDAASLPEAVATAWSNLVDVGRLSSGQSVLVHGGSGGVGSVAIQLAAAVGARVLTTASGPERCTRCLELGADVAIDHRRADFTRSVLSHTDGKGVDLVLDVLGGGALAANLACLAVGGRLVVIGMQQGRRAELDLGTLLARRASIIGTTLRARPLAEREAIIESVRREVWPLLDDGRLTPVVHARLPLARAGQAHELLDSGEVFGKLVLVV